MGCVACGDGGGGRAGGKGSRLQGLHQLEESIQATSLSTQLGTDVIDMLQADRCGYSRCRYRCSCGVWDVVRARASGWRSALKG